MTQKASKSGLATGIKRLVNKLGTAYELASIVHVSPSRISEWSRGKGSPPSADVMVKLGKLTLEHGLPDRSFFGNKRALIVSPYS